jgi:heat shock protein HslJ
VTELTGTVWALTAIESVTGLIENPAPERFTVEFLPDGQLAARFDCNMGGGVWSADGPTLVIGQLMSTLMGCLDPSPLTMRFSQALGAAISWSITEGVLRIDSGTGDSLVFAPSMVVPA